MRGRRAPRGGATHASDLQQRGTGLSAWPPCSSLHALTLDFALWTLRSRHVCMRRPRGGVIVCSRPQSREGACCSLLMAQHRQHQRHPAAVGQGCAAWQRRHRQIGAPAARRRTHAGRSPSRPRPAGPAAPWRGGSAGLRVPTQGRCAVPGMRPPSPAHLADSAGSSSLLFWKLATNACLSGASSGSPSRTLACGARAPPVSARHPARDQAALWGAAPAPSPHHGNKPTWKSVSSAPGA